MKYKNDSVKTIVLRTLRVYVVTLGLMVLMLWLLGTYNLVYQEHLQTFYFDNLRLLTIFERPGGLCRMIADLMIQYFVYPWAALVLTAVWLAAVATFTIRIIWSINHSWAATPLGMLPATSMAYLLFNPNFMFSGLISYTMMAVVLSYIVRRDGSLRYTTPINRLLFVGVATVLLYTLAGAVAMLFAIEVFIIKLYVRPRMAPYYLAGPLLALALGWVSVNSGVINDLAHAITPEAYFTARLDAPALVYSPWWILVLVTIAAFTLARVVKSPNAKAITFALTATITLVGTVVSQPRLVNPKNELFKELNCYIRCGEWERVIERTDDEPLDNLVLQNCRNLALAEIGELADSLFTKPCYDIRSIYITGESKPYFNMLLSDIYYSMGHIALAQRHAFEALESLNNVSPRMLQRLVQTNIIYGNYKVAELYIKRLAKTRMYKGWAEEMRTKLNDQAVMADPELGSKRRCLQTPNHFSALNGLDKDLREVVRANPAHRPTIEYLGSLYLLSKDLPSFMDVMSEHYGTEALPAGDLPEAFAEAVLVADPEHRDSLIAHYGIKPSTIERFNRFVANPKDEPSTFWYFLKYTR